MEVSFGRGPSVHRVLRRRTALRIQRWVGMQWLLSSRAPFHAAKSGVDILIVRLKPVAEAGTQHDRGGHRAAAFEYIMFTVEKRLGVAGIERHGLEAGERRELRG